MEAAGASTRGGDGCLRAAVCHGSAVRVRADRRSPEEPQGPSRGAAIEAAALTMRPGGAVPPLGTLPGQPQPRSVVAERGVGPVAHAPHGRGGRLGRDRLEREAREVQPVVPRYARGWYAYGGKYRAWDPGSKLPCATGARSPHVQYGGLGTYVSAQSRAGPSPPPSPRAAVSAWRPRRGTGAARSRGAGSCASQATVHGRPDEDGGWAPAQERTT